MFKSVCSIKNNIFKKVPKSAKKDGSHGCYSNTSLVHTARQRHPAAVLAGQTAKQHKTHISIWAQNEKRWSFTFVWQWDESGGRRRPPQRSERRHCYSTAGKQLRQDAKRPSLVLITHAGTVHCVQLCTHQHTHRLTLLTYTCTGSRWHNQPVVTCAFWRLDIWCVSMVDCAE